MDSHIVQYKAAPQLDVKKFMENYHFDAFDERSMHFVTRLWEKWVSKLHVLILDVEPDGIVAVWIDDEIVEEIAVLWDTSPSFGYMADVLAGELCMAGLRELEPEVARDGCAALAALPERASQLLREAGAQINEQSQTLAYRYGIFTHYPYKGSCDVCILKNECSQPRKSARHSKQ